MRLTQVQLALRAGVTRRDVRLLERGHGRRLRWETLEAIFGALGARFGAGVLWNGPGLDRLLDGGHAAVAATVKRRLERWHWQVRIEVSYNRYGERGRIDLLAFHQATGILLVLEIKTAFVDVQDLLGTLDVKARLAPMIVDRFGWAPRATVPGIVFVDSHASRAHVARLDTLFDRFTIRGRSSLSWLRRPADAPTGILWFTRAPEAASVPMRTRVYHRSRAA